jgi:hypothetical protein
MRNLGRGPVRFILGTLLVMGTRRRPSVLLLRLASPRRTEQLTAVLHLNVPLFSTRSTPGRSSWSKMPASVFVPYP